MSEGVEITLRDVYEAQQQTQAQVSAAVGQLALLTAQVSERLDHGQRKLDDHELRIRQAEQLPKVSPAKFETLETRVGALESFKAKMIGIGTVGAILAGVLSAVIEHALTR